MCCLLTVAIFSEAQVLVKVYLESEIIYCRSVSDSMLNMQTSYWGLPKFAIVQCGQLYSVAV